MSTMDLVIEMEYLDIWSKSRFALLLLTYNPGKDLQFFHNVIYSGVQSKKLTPVGLGEIPGRDPRNRDFDFSKEECITFANEKEFELPKEFTVAKKPKSQNQTLHATERETLLKLVLGMAIDKYGYKPGGRNTATGGNNGSIKCCLQNLGLEVDEDTIRNHLKEGYELFQDIVTVQP